MSHGTTSFASFLRPIAEKCTGEKNRNTFFLQIYSFTKSTVPKISRLTRTTFGFQQKHFTETADDSVAARKMQITARRPEKKHFSAYNGSYLNIITKYEPDTNRNLLFCMNHETAEACYDNLMLELITDSLRIT
jgi:hypothetical protein